MVTLENCIGMKQIIQNMRARGSPESQIAGFESTLAGCDGVGGVVTEQPSPAAAPNDLPPVHIRGWNFAGAMARWAGSGFQMRTQAEIDERLAICQACPHLVNDHCSLCGCKCVATNQVVNKLALKGQECPIGKWS
jgi:hypothetical protein